MIIRRLVTILGLAVLLSAATRGAVADGPIVNGDSSQHELHFDRTPQRIITLLPSLTETVCALGECARLVATDRCSEWPASVKSLPKVGGLDDAQIEPIVSLQPDLVILAYQARVTGRLHELDVKALVVETGTYADIARAVRAIGLL